MRKHVIAGIIFALSLIADIVSKYLVVAYIGKDRVNVIGEFVQFILIFNRGGLWGILQDYQLLFLIVSMIVFVLLILFYVYEKNKTPLFSYAMALIASGAIGNILDRVMSIAGVDKRTGVVDFIYIGNDNFFRWPAFNIADSAIVIGAALLIIVFYREERRKKKEG